MEIDRNDENRNPEQVDSHSTDESLYPIAVLIDELRVEDVQVRLRAVEKLRMICKALGPERTRDELLPFISETVYDEDEVLLALAEQLGEMVPEVGGAEYAYTLLESLDRLSQVEETIVRDKAIESINKLIETQNVNQIELHFLPLLKKLACGDWFTSRTSSCGLFASCYSRVNPSQQIELRNTFKQLAQDDTPMVRRAAISKMGELVKVMELDSIMTDIVPLFQALAEDDQDSVRLLAAECVKPLAETLPEGERVTILWQHIHTFIEDKSWRVRYIFADNIVDLMQIINPSQNHEVQQNFVKAMTDILQDAEQEVRTAGAEKVGKFAACLIPTNRSDIIIDQLLEHLQRLTSDASNHVRTALAGIIMGLAPLIGKQNTITHFLPLYLSLLKDECPEVRLNIITNLDALNKVIGIDMLIESLLPAIMELAEDAKWRVRLAIIEHMPLLAKQVGKEVFDSKLVALVLSWLSDHVYAIRDAATENVKALSETFGIEWTNSFVIPRIKELAQDNNYLRRLTCLFAINKLVQVVATDFIVQSILPIMFNLLQDQVPNVRFNVAKTVSQIQPYLDHSSAEVKEQIVNSLNMLVQDTDVDVKFFANEALVLYT